MGVVVVTGRRMPRVTADCEIEGGPVQAWGRIEVVRDFAAAVVRVSFDVDDVAGARAVLEAAVANVTAQLDRVPDPKARATPPKPARTAGAGPRSIQ